MRRCNKTTLIRDERGHALICTRSDDWLEVTVDFLPKGKIKSKYLGHIDTMSRKFYCKRTNRHIFKRANSFGFNYKLINESKLFDTVVIKHGKLIYEVPRQFIINNGRVLNFQKQGHEVQVFIRIDYIQRYLTFPINAPY